MPEELIEIAKSLNCDQVFGFYNERPGRLEPPFIYGVLSGDRENSAVFWCMNKLNPRIYKLILVFRKSFHDRWNHEIILETRNNPNGLSIVKNCKISLDNFRYIENPSKRGPKNVLPSSNVILSCYDGVEEYFYKDSGHWLICVRH